MHIKLTGFYRGGATNFALIPPGVYDIHDPALYGAGRYLLETHHAIEVDAPLTETLLNSDGEPLEGNSNPPVPAGLDDLSPVEPEPESFTVTPPASDLPESDEPEPEPTPEPTIVEDGDDLTLESLDAMNKADLIELAESLGLEVGSKDTKADIIATLQEAGG